MHTSVHLSPLACLHTATQHLLYSCEGMKEIKKQELGYTQGHLQTRQVTCVFSIANICQPHSRGHLEINKLVMFTWFHKHYINPFPLTRSIPAERRRAGGLATLNIIPGKVVGKCRRIRLSFRVSLIHSFFCFLAQCVGRFSNKSRVLTLWLHRTSSTCATSPPDSQVLHTLLTEHCLCLVHAYKQEYTREHTSLTH